MRCKSITKDFTLFAIDIYGRICYNINNKLYVVCISKRSDIYVKQRYSN